MERLSAELTKVEELLSYYTIAGENDSPSTLGGYSVGRKLGDGAFSEVKLGEKSGIQVALKVIPNTENNLIEKEVKILRSLKHKHIIQLVEVVEIPERKLTCLVLELASGGDLLEYIVSRKKLDEKEAVKILRQIISALEYLHSNFIIHRDLKPENVLLDSKMNVKLCDFGVSEWIKFDQLMTNFCGSPHYNPPEIHLNQGAIGPEIDIWSLGVLVYVMITGNMPWEGESQVEQLENCVKGIYSVPSYVSEECRHFLSRTLMVDSRKRATLEEIRTHPWVTIEGWNPLFSHVPRRSIVGSREIDETIVKQLANFGYDPAETMKNLKSSDSLHKQSAVFYWMFKDRETKEKRRSVDLTWSVFLKQSLGNQHLAIPNFPLASPTKESRFSLDEEDIQSKVKRQNPSKKRYSQN